MPVIPLFLDTRRRKLQEIREFDYNVPGGAKTFTLTAVFEPHRLSSAAHKAAVHEIIGDNQCLGITADNVDLNIQRSNFNLVARARDKAANDRAICTIQLTDWCRDSTEPAQVWINDLCRLTTLPKEARTEPSPVAVLLAYVESLVALYGIRSTWLLIEKQETETHKPLVLLKIYDERYGYKLVKPGTASMPCSLSEEMRAEYYVMRKDLTAAAAAAGF